MLNISKNNIEDISRFKEFRSYQMTLPNRSSKKRVRIMIYIMVGIFLFLFLPWTQNIRSKGYVTALRPDQRPQTVHSIIPGRIEEWYVQEGDFVQKGDTILRISEVKDEYFDPLLLERTRDQADAKRFAAQSYADRVNAQKGQISALSSNRILRKEQAENRLRMAELKVVSDSIRLEQSKINFEIGVQQLERAETLFEKGLRSFTDLETRRLRFQEVQANLISAENQLLSSKNEKIAAQIEINAIDNDFKDRLARTESDMFSAMSSQFDAEATATKLENQFSNYEIRSNYLFILAPQDGYITRAIQVGLGETIKEGAEIVSIIPANPQLAVEMYVEPVDLPLIKLGDRVRFIFDGWPAIVFSGWPQLSNGTFPGVVAAIDNFTGPNNKYRVVVVEDKEDDPWPVELRIGSGADGIALLNDVPIWYEIWRILNGFPADYYTNREKQGMANNKEK
jgi:multidrug resistance efflux pump